MQLIHAVALQAYLTKSGAVLWLAIPRGTTLLYWLGRETRPGMWRIDVVIDSQSSRCWRRTVKVPSSYCSLVPIISWRRGTISVMCKLHWQNNKLHARTGVYFKILKIYNYITYHVETASYWSMQFRWIQNDMPSFRLDGAGQFIKKNFVNRLTRVITARLSVAGN